MNLITIPFHHWRKILKEGFRTRDAHFIEHFEKNPAIEKTIVINRPTTLFELFVKKFPVKIKGEVLLKENGFSLLKISENLYLIDFVSNDIIGQFKKKYSWFFEEYANPKYVAFIKKSLTILGVHQYFLVTQNIFAHTLLPHLSPIKSVFDAWDNFYKINTYHSIKAEIKNAYKSYANGVHFWITNSRDNLVFYEAYYKPNSIHLIANGLDTSRFNTHKKYPTPSQFKNISRPIIGFGGKITQTIDLTLLNFAIEDNPAFSFVVMGQKLDKNIFNAISKRDNFYYLGDIHYDLYPDYVAQFDICLVPYHITQEKQSGANPIKVYEYLALHKKVIGTNGNGLEDLSSYLYLVETKEALSAEIKKGVNNTKNKINPTQYSWDGKVAELIKLMVS
ncbi:MAG: glycosyltransferase [Flavobacteriaceae bacterium]